VLTGRLASVRECPLGGYNTDVLALTAVLLLLAHGSGALASPQVRAKDPPILVPWNRIGDIELGEPKARLEQEYGAPRGSPQPYYRVTDFGFTKSPGSSSICAKVTCRASTFASRYID
jgi:hypothetical protein